jgi:SAM-dependent methyltransferase
MLSLGTAAKIPLDDSSVDMVVSGLVLNFVPDPNATLIEMSRVTDNRGIIAAYVWDYAGKMEFMRIFWDAVTELNPDAARLDEGLRFPICSPEVLMDTFTQAGLDGAEVTAIDTPTPFASFEDYWQPFLGGQGPGPAYVMALDAVSRERLRERLRQRLPVEGVGSIALIARAWAIRATVAK